LPFHPQDYKQITQRSYYPMTGVGWDNISPGAKDLVARLLRKRSEKRLTVKQILAHPWVVSEAPDEDLGADYFTRLKHLALRQRLKAFFNDSNIEEDNKERQQNLKNVIPMLHMKNTEFDGKLKVLKHHMVDVIKKSSSSFDEKTLGTSASVVASNAPPGEIGYDEFCAVLDKAGLPEMKSQVVFGIFDTGNTGKKDVIYYIDK
jgi:serine/threonine protein kinase